jgi:RNase P subunit RPR2
MEQPELFETDHPRIEGQRAVTCTECAAETDDHRVYGDREEPMGPFCKRCHDALVADGRASWRPWV